MQHRNKVAPGTESQNRSVAHRGRAYGGHPLAQKVELEDLEPLLQWCSGLGIGFASRWMVRCTTKRVSRVFRGAQRPDVCVGAQAWCTI